MENGIFFSIISLFYCVMITCIYFFKKKVKNIENRIYSKLLVTNLFGLIIEVFPATYASRVLVDTNYSLAIIILKLILVYFVVWISIFTDYVIYISLENRENHDKQHLANKIRAVVTIIGVIAAVVTLLLPLDAYSKNGAAYTYGVSANFCYIFSGICILIWIFYLIRNFKQVAQKKYTPIYFFIVLGIIVMLIQYKYPELTLMISMQTFITSIMYFTIENPDMRLIEQLNIARDQAERANNAKSEFLSNMSHEIRTPLNAIVGFSQALAEEENVPEEAKDEIKDIMMASQNLLEIVNGILDISKIEAGKLEIVNTEYSLKNVLEELTALTTSRIGEKPITLRTVFDPSIPQVLYGDYVRLKQIVLNLLTNAAKYTKEGYIEFKVDSVIKDDVCRLIISVEDTGIGIKKESIDKLFNKFERLDLEKNITIEGTGLGLAITKKLVELMNGSIVVQSEYGNGSKFTVAIDQRIVEGKETIANEINTEIDLFDAKGKRILLVDDNKINLKVAVRLLQSYQMQIDQAMSGQECLDKIKEGNAYDLILLDDMMPKMSGVETLKELQKIEGFETPTIAFTANAISGMKEKYLSDGFHDYLSKPIDKLELNQLLKKYLKEGEK